jgi:ABC-type nitrate/sulfonate/bicarbonate transport system permease component
MQPWAAVSGMRSTVLVLVGLVLAWELAVRGLDLQPILLPAPSRIAVELASAPWY